MRGIVRLFVVLLAVTVSIHSAKAQDWDGLYEYVEHWSESYLQAAEERGDDGSWVLAWSWSYQALAAIDLYKASGQERFADIVNDAFPRVWALRDEVRGKTDEVRHRTMPGWGYSDPEGRWINGTAVNGMILYVFSKLAEAAPDVFQHEDQLDATALEVLRAFQADLIIEDDGAGYYRRPDNGRVDALNHSHALGAAFAVQYRLTGNQEFAAPVMALLAFFKRCALKETNGSLSWAYAPTETNCKTNNPEWVHKAQITMLLPVEAHYSGLGWDDSDMVALQNTFLKNVAQEQGINARISGNSFEPIAPNRAFSLFGWMILEGPDNPVGEVLKELAETRNDLFPEEWWMSHRVAVRGYAAYLAAQ